MSNSNAAAPDPQTARRVIREAAAWYSQLCSGEAGAEEKQAWQRWLDQGWEHQWAWSRVEHLQQQMSVSPGLVTRNVLDSSAEEMRARRRSLLKGFGMVAVAAPLAWQGWRTQLWQAVLADYSTATGERREWMLADGTRLTLNTDSAVNVVFDQHVRMLHLVKGEIYIETGHGARTQGRPLIVKTAQASLRALGTQFAVRQLAESTWLGVMQHAVEVTPVHTGQAYIVPVGRQATIDGHASGSLLALAGNEASWRRGMLVVSDWRLEDMVAELGRYRRGVLRCDPQLVEQRISGAFPLDDTNVALEAIQTALPQVRIDYFTRYWVTLRSTT